eukprot:UN20501
MDLPCIFQTVIVIMSLQNYNQQLYRGCVIPRINRNPKNIFRILFIYMSKLNTFCDFFRNTKNWISR